MLEKIFASQVVPASVTAVPQGGEVLNGNMPTDDLAVLCRIVRHFRPRTAFEFGTFIGGTTLNIARHAADDAIIYTLDLPAKSPTTFPLAAGEREYIDKPEVGTIYRGTPEAAKIVQLFGDSALFDFGRFVGLMDFALVDASHEYENCLNDSLRAYTLRGPSGVTVWHDYGVWPGVTTALDDLQRSGGRFRSLRHIDGTSLAILL